ncbi:MAG: formylglycine-generating enzyme family protein [Treponema sp.]|nr:formylglycine-generating enzyme family protein [Treponema sp.]
MKDKITLIGIFVLAVVIGFTMAACEGPIGPIGLTGEKGEQGQTGDDGSDAPFGSLVVFFHRNNNDTGSTDPYPVILMLAPGTSVQQLPLPPTRAGYVPGSWNTKPDGSGTVFTAATTVTANTTVYAQWLVDINAATITVTSTHVYDGTEQESEFTVTHNGVDLAADTDFTVVYENTINAGTATITITGMAENGYGGTATAQFTIEKAVPTVTAWPADLAAIYGQTLARVTIGYGTASVPGSFAWTNPDDPVGAVGTQAHRMTFTPGDGDNFHAVTDIVHIKVLLGLEMVRVDGGTFQMGKNGNGAANNVTPVHTVTLSDYYMGKYQITQEQYFAVMGVNPSNFASNPPDRETQGMRPVETVSWYSAIEFCNRLSRAEGLTPTYSIDGETDPDVWISTHGAAPTSMTIDSRWNFSEMVSDSNGYRLPTEAQWEFAAKGGTRSTGYTGDAGDTYFIYSGSDDPNAVAWYSQKTGTPTAYITHEVGLLAPNELGIYDMSGNVFEWCWDRHGAYSSDAKTNPTGAPSGYFNVMRGGDWGSRAPEVSSVSRDGYWPSVRNGETGFRVARP